MINDMIIYDLLRKSLTDDGLYIYILCMSEKYRIVVTWFHIGMLCPMVYVQICTPYMNILENYYHIIFIHLL